MEKLKNNRAASFVTVAIIYILATLVGLATYYLARDLGWWLALLASDVVATVFTYAFSVILGNASVYDPYWSVQPPVILLAFALGNGLNAFGVLLLVAVGFWAIRLTANWAYTFVGLCHQDWRYTMLHETTGRAYPLVNLVCIHLVPTLIVYGCTLPAVYAIRAGLASPCRRSCFSFSRCLPLACRVPLISRCTATAKTAPPPSSASAFGNTPATRITSAKS